MAVTGKIDRKYMAHYIDAGSLCGGLTPKYERLGKDLEEYNVELNPDTETSKNILGESTFKHNGYEVSSDADPFYADTTSDLFTALQKIVDGRLKDDNLKTKAVEVPAGLLRCTDFLWRRYIRLSDSVYCELRWRTCKRKI